MPMRGKQLLREVKSAVEMAASGRFGRKRICVVYGNCQADALRRTLMLAPGFRAEYVAVKVPPVHLISAPQVGPLRALIRRADLFITQPIRDDLRGMEIGTGQISRSLSKSAQVITYPSMYFDGFHPYQVTVHAPGSDLSTAAPVTDYHDLRFMFAAAQGWDLPKAREWFDSFAPDPAYVRDVYEKSLATLGERESVLDTNATPAIRENGGKSFFTLNHPANVVLRSVADQVLGRLGVDAAAPPADVEFLGALKAPVDIAVADALGVAPGAPATDWTVRGESVSQPRILAAHLEWYRSHPETLQAGLVAHGERMAGAGLSVNLPR